jgi:transmembrane sensor
MEDRAAEQGRLEGEALDWIVRLTSGTATEADRAALMRWRGQSEAHEQAFVCMARFSARLRQAARECSDATAERRRPSVRLPAASGLTRRRAIAGAGAAASVTAYIMATHPPLGLWPSIDELQADYRTGTGQKRDIALARGVSVEMNTQTSISVPASRSRPRIQLISGEAVVAANRASDPPVIVAAAAGQASTNAGEFDIQCQGASVSVTCLKGTVDVAHAGQTVLLQAGQQSRYGDGPMRRAEDVDLTLVTAWRSGLLIFRDRPLRDVVAELNRYRRGRILLTSDRLARIPMNGVFHLDRLDDVIEQIKALGAHETNLPGGIVLLG